MISKAALLTLNCVLNVSNYYSYATAEPDGKPTETRTLMDVFLHIFARLLISAGALFGSLHQSLTLVLLYVLYRGTCVMEIQKQLLRVYVRRSALVVAVVIGANVAEAFGYTYAFGYTLLALVIVDKVKPLVSLLITVFTFGHAFFGLKIMQALRHSESVGAVSVQQRKNYANIRVAVLIILLSQLGQFSVYVAEAATESLFLSQIYACVNFETCAEAEDALTSIKFLPAIQTLFPALGNVTFLCYLVWRKY